MPFINYRCPYDGGIETVDSFESWAEARKMAAEYHLAGPGFYLSQRATKEWRESEAGAAQ